MNVYKRIIASLLPRTALISDKIKVVYAWKSKYAQIILHNQNVTIRKALFSYRVQYCKKL